MSAALELSLPAMVPLFPLPEHVLLPAAPTPYRIFEARYRQLVEDLLDKPSSERLLVVPRATGAGPAGDGPFHPVAALARVVATTPLADGEFLIVVEGVLPCEVEEVDAPFTPYRLARVNPLRDRPSPGRDALPTADALIQALFCLIELLGPNASDLPIPRGALDRADALVAYRIGAAILTDVDRRQQLLDERCPARRRALVLDELTDLLSAASRTAYHRPATGSSL